MFDSPSAVLVPGVFCFLWEAWSSAFRVFVCMCVRERVSVYVCICDLTICES